MAGILFELAKRGFAAYVSRVPAYTMVYGTFATFPIFLIWIYLSWLVTVLGAIVAASLPDYGIFKRPSKLSAGSRFSDALTVLLVLADGHAQGMSQTSQQIASLTGMSRDCCEQMLGTLGELSWAGRIESGRWALICSPEFIRLSQVSQYFLLASDAVAEDAITPKLRAFFRRFGAEIDDILGMSLADLFRDKATD